MSKSKSLGEAISALKNVTKTLFQKMPVLFLMVIYIFQLCIQSYLSEGLSVILLLCAIILMTSIGIFISTKSYSQTTLSFILGILTVYTINWETANYKLFIFVYLIYTVSIFYISVIGTMAKQEVILIQAATKLDINDFDPIFKRLKKISMQQTKGNQLTIIERSEIIRYLAFRQVIIGEYEESIDVIELIKSVCQISVNDSCELYYSLYMYCRNTDDLITNYPRAVERLIDRITTVPLSYTDFFSIFNNTKRILYDRTLGFTEYIVEIKKLAIKGYSATDIVDFIKNEYL